MIGSSYYMFSDFKVMAHLIYEYKKGLRQLALITIQEVDKDKINIFFGDSRCLRIIESFNQSSLSKLSDEQDFMLGIMLGYDRAQQCERYLSRTQKHGNLLKAV